MDNNIVINSFIYYDKNKEKYDNITKNVKYVNFPAFDKDDKGDIKRKHIVMYDKNKKPIFSSKYEIIGLYENVSNTWSWAWSVPRFKKNITYISRKILNYGLDLDISEQHSLFLKTELITGKFKIHDPVQLELHAAIASYISKNPFIFKFVKTASGPEEFVDVSNTKNTHNIDGLYSLYYLFILDHDTINKT